MRRIVVTGLGVVSSIGNNAGEVKFTGMIVPSVKKLTYHVHLKRVMLRKLVLGIADGFVHADGQQIYEVSGLKVGLVQDAAAMPAAAG